MVRDIFSNLKKKSTSLDKRFAFKTGKIYGIKISSSAGYTVT